LTTEDTRGWSRKGRPNYKREFRYEIATAACEPGVSVAKLAQSHGLNPNMVFKWRRQYRAGLLSTAVSGETAVLVPVEIAPTDSVVAAPVVPAQSAGTETVSGIEIELNGARVRVTGKVDPVQLRLVLRCLMPA
jgi:transposase